MPQNQKSLSLRADQDKYRIPKGKNYLLLIGIDKYPKDIPQLNNAVKDAIAFRNVLWEQYQFEPSQTIELFDEQATRSAIIRTFDDLIKRISDQDNLVFYFSGHGGDLSK